MNSKEVLYESKLTEQDLYTTVCIWAYKIIRNIILA